VGDRQQDRTINRYSDDLEQCFRRKPESDSVSSRTAESDEDRKIVDVTS
jgi:hypothetical protein